MSPAPIDLTGLSNIDLHVKLRDVSRDARSDTLLVVTVAQMLEWRRVAQATLRDQLACAALTGMARHVEPGLAGPLAYRHADSALNARLG